MKYIVVMCIALLYASGAYGQMEKLYELPSKGVRDTAMMMLREFVIDHGDQKLGFTPENVKDAVLDDGSPVNFYQMDEGKIYTTEDIDTLFLAIRKVFYPIYVGKKLCGSVAFINGPNGWMPSEFQDSVELNELMNTMAHLNEVKINNRRLSVVYIPSLNHSVILEDQGNAPLITSPNVLDTTRANTFNSGKLKFLNKPHLSFKKFIQGYREMLQDTTKKR